MTQSDSALSVSGSYLCALFLVAGPWIFTALGLAGLTALASNGQVALELFRSIVIYNFCFSVVITGAIAMPVTRFVSDQMYARDSSRISSACTAALAAYAVAGLVLILPFYLFAAQLAPVELGAAFANAMLIGATWLLLPFVGAMRRYALISTGFLVGMIVSLGVAWVTEEHTVATLLMAFNAGLAVLNACLLLLIQHEFGAPSVPDFALFRQCARYWDLALIGLFLNLGMWADKVIMWAGAPDGVLVLAGAFLTMPSYDSVMFWAQLTAIPLLTAFFVHVEPGFYRLCRPFYESFGRHATCREVADRLERIRSYTIQCLSSLFGGGLVITLASVLLSYVAIEQLAPLAAQGGMLRAGFFGVVFHTSAMFAIVFLLYFDLRRHALVIAGVFLLLNSLLTIALIPAGFSYYGYGFTLAAALTFLLARLVLYRELSWLHYHAFVTNNVSITAATAGGKGG